MRCRLRFLSTLPDVSFELDEHKFLTNLRKSRQGAAGGPSGMTSHLRPVLDLVTRMLGLSSSWVSNSHEQRPDSVVAAIRLGRMTALMKRNGGVRGIVVGDIVWRLVARRTAQQMIDVVEARSVSVRIFDASWHRVHRTRTAVVD